MSSDFNNLDKLTSELYAELITKSEQEIAQKEEQMRAKLAEQKKADLAEIEAYRQAMKADLAQQKLQMESQLALKADGLLEEIRLKLKREIAKEFIQKPLKELFSDQEFLKQYIFKLAEQLQDSENLKLSLSADALKNWQIQLVQHFPNLKLEVGPVNQEVLVINGTEGFHFSLGEEELARLFYSYLDEALQAILKSE